MHYFSVNIHIYCIVMNFKVLKSPDQPSLWKNSFLSIFHLHTENKVISHVLMKHCICYTSCVTVSREHPPLSDSMSIHGWRELELLWLQRVSTGQTLSAFCGTRRVRLATIFFNYVILWWYNADFVLYMQLIILQSNSVSKSNSFNLCEKSQLWCHHLL